MSAVRMLLFSALFGACLPCLAQAQEVKPPLVVRGQSVDEMKENIAYFGSLAGHDELKILLKFINLPAIDSKKPFGLYATLGAKPADCALVGMVPVTSENEFVEILSLFKLKLTKGADGIYLVKNAAQPIHIRFAAGYAYVAHGSREVLAGKLLDPKQVAPADPTELFAISLRPDQIPDNLKKEVTDWISDTSKLMLQFKVPFENEKQRALRNEFIKFVAEEHLMWIQDAGEFTHSVKLDRKAHRFTVETILAARPNSRLAGRFAELAKGQSLFSGMVGGNAAMSGAGHFQVPAELRKPMGEAIDHFMQLAEQHAKQSNRESDLAILKALVPSMKSGEMDDGFSLRGPAENGLYTFVGGARVKDGGAIDKALRNRIKELPVAVGKYFKLDGEKAGDVKIHRMDFPEKLLKQHEKLLKHHVQAFGKNPVYFAFRDDALIVGGGDKGLAALKEALAAQPKAGPAGQFSLSVARLAAGHAKLHAPIAKAAQEAFGNDKEGGKISFILDGGDVVRMRFDMDTSVMKFLAKIIMSR
jgi:hypothetical protein